MLNIVSDFDGTVTDVQRESETYYSAYRQRLAEFINISEYELEAFMELARTEIVTNPGLYGWEVGGVIVAPATADPYLFAQAAAGLVLKNYLKGDLVPPKEEWGELFNILFAYAYPKAGVFFRPGAKDYVQRLNQLCKFHIVTNSGTSNVNRKLAMLVDEGVSVKVIGDAKKFLIDNSYTDVPEKITPSGFPRPAYLRRARYAAVLASLGEVDGVCGDVWELDLALPERFGIYTALLLSETTPSWEKEHYRVFENGISSTSLLELLDYLLTM